VLQDVFSPSILFFSAYISEPSGPSFSKNVSSFLPRLDRGSRLFFPRKFRLPSFSRTFFSSGLRTSFSQKTPPQKTGCCFSSYRSRSPSNPPHTPTWCDSRTPPQFSAVLGASSVSPRKRLFSPPGGPMDFPPAHKSGRSTHAYLT